MTVWVLIYNVLVYIVDGMESVDIMYGLSIWDLFMIFVLLSDITFILHGIFGGDENGDDN